jgi:hypothetical protein
MASQSEYHQYVRLSLSASLLFASLILMAATLAPISHAQINGTPSSVTSPGFGGRAVNGPPSSVTSLGPRGYSSHSHVSFSTTVPNLHRRGDGQHRRNRERDFVGPVYYAVPVPYAVDEGASDDAYANDDSDHQGGPTVFDRRGSGPSSYIPPVKDSPAPHYADRSDDPPSNPEPAQPTILVFKDGHELEVGNYAIQGTTLFDLTPGHSRKIAIADLDLEATRQQNDDRGVVFQLPPSLQAN